MVFYNFLRKMQLFFSWIKVFEAAALDYAGKIIYLKIRTRMKTVFEKYLCDINQTDNIQHDTTKLWT